MSTRSRYDDLHDEYLDDEIAKQGTRYERLVALVQKSLDETAGVVHDVKLVGTSVVKHQIDVTVSRGSSSRRLLIECKDFDVSGDPVGLSIVRDFFGAVEDIRPDEALIVTCNRFTRDATRYAKAKGIKLAILRDYTEADDAGRIKAISVTGHIHGYPRDVEATMHFADPASLQLYPLASGAKEHLDEQSDVFLLRPGCPPTQYIVAVNDLLRTIPMPEPPEPDSKGSWREVKLPLPGTAVQRASQPPLPLSAITFRFFQSYHRQAFTITSDKIAKLILTPLGQDTDLLIYEDVLQNFTIDPATGEVLELKTNTTDEC